MIFILLITLIIILFILIDLVPVAKEKQWLIFWVYTSLIVLVYVSALLIELEIKIPSPAVPLKKIIETILGLFN